MKETIKQKFKKIKLDFKNKNYKKQIPNILTSIRLLSPFILIPLFIFNKIKLAIAVIAFLALTDTFDGYLARKYGAISVFGKYLDALVDKIFAITILISLLIINAKYSYYYLIIIILIFESIIAVINLYSFFKNLNPNSTKCGKIKTIVLFSLLVVTYLNNIITISNKIIISINIITIVLQILAITTYLNQVKKSKKLLNLN